MDETPDLQEPVVNAKPQGLSASGAAASADLVATAKNFTDVVKEPVTESDLTHAQTHLKPEEEMLWTARCSPNEFKDLAKITLIFGAPIVLFIAIVFIFVIGSFLNFSSSGGAFGAIGIFGLIFVLVVGLVFVVMVWRIVPMLRGQEKVGEKSIYVLTNRRLFISTTGESSPRQTWDLRRVENVSCKVYPDGSGQLRFLYGKGTWNNERWYKYRHDWISGIPDVRSAEKVLAAAVVRCIQETGRI